MPDTSRAIFLDKDGTLIENVPHNVDRTRIRLQPGAVDALLLLSGLGYRIIVASNQPGVARGLFPAGALRAVEEHLDDLFLAYGFTLTDCYWCPHDPKGIVEDYAFECDCRKPRPGMLRAAAAAHDLDLARSWLIGDNLDDIEAGKRAGCRTVLLDAARASPGNATPQRTPDIVVPNLLEAAAAIQRATADERAEETP